MKSLPGLNPLPIVLANPINMNPLFCFDNCAVSVNYYIYDKKKKTIVKFGSSRACGVNHRSSSIHAEELAINYCLHNDKRNRYIIIISRFNREGEHKYKTCCAACTQLANKYNFQNKIFTIGDNNQLVPAIVENPEISLAYKIKYDL